MSSHSKQTKRPSSFLVSRFALLVSLIALVHSELTFAELYKYINEDGVTVLDSHVPARYVKDGYTILRLDGRVLEVVSRALSDKEILIRDQNLAEERRLNRIEREQKIADQNLLRIYSTPEDVVRVRDDKMASIEFAINTSKGRESRLKSQKRDMQAQLADIERAGGTISNERLAQIRGIDSKIRQNEREMASKLDEMLTLQASYAADLKRVRELYDEFGGN
ncbi:MAG: hypothetical protein ACI9FB_002483 [Candidatus Azotimanducaceae bacterium]|jgi:hypothetical protein